MGVCTAGYYGAVLTPEQANASIVGDLPSGSDVCVPCDEVCSRCTGPGNRLGSNRQLSSCQECRFASQESFCVQECNSTGKYHTMASM